jgi:hypothetical protein
LERFSDGIIRDRDLSQNIHFFEENRQPAIPAATAS